jgi:hypothetical protein
MENGITRSMKKITYQEETIYHAAYAGVDMLDLAAEIKANEDSLSEMFKAGLEDLLLLTDVTGCHIDNDALMAFQSLAKTIEPHTKASAVVGATGLRKFLLEAVNKFSPLETKPFDTTEEALEWLVSK